MIARHGTLAIEGGDPVRKELLPYGRQAVDEADVRAVVEVLRSDWLTTGPAVDAFEQAFAETAGAKHAVAVSSGTAALHAAVFAAGIGPDDEVIVPPMTFVATANAVVFQGGTPVFADVDRGTLLLDPDRVEASIGPRTRAVLAVDYAGQPCDYDRLRDLADARGLVFITDACHALGGSHRGRPVGSLVTLNAFSFHPVKHITTGEGGMVTTDDGRLAERMRRFRSHGIASDFRRREQQGSWAYEMTELGWNYRLTDLQSVLGLSQLRKLPEWVRRRREIAARYDDALACLDGVSPLAVRDGARHAYHLYVVRLDLDALSVGRGEVFAALREEGIGVNVHYIPVHLHPFYRERFGTGPGLCPVAEAAYESLLSLPLFPAMTDGDVADVIEAVDKVIGAYRR
jgi:perosamine synthetase